MASSSSSSSAATKKVGKFEIGKTLGEGTFGKVKFAVNPETGEKVAIKILDKEKIQKQNMGQQVKKEISIMKVVKHENVVKLHEVLASRTKIFIVLELITGGELFDKIVTEGRFSEATARFYFRQLIKGVKYCHGQGVCHRDLKPENLLLDMHGNLKISDFGLSALYTGSADDEDRATLLHTTCGTPNYVAPEVLADKGYDGRAADMWSCGVILYVLLAGYLPFDEPHMSALFRKIQRAEFTYPAWFSADVRALIDKILVPDVTKRIVLPEIELDAWFVGPDGYKDDNLPFSFTEKAASGAALPSPSPFAASCATSNEAFSPAGAGAPSSAKADIDSAVGEIDDTPVSKATPATTSAAGSVAPPPGGSSTPPPQGPLQLNAFDVLTVLGGMDVKALLPAGAAAASDATSGAPLQPQFLTKLAVPALLERLRAGFISIGAATPVSVEGGFKVKAKVSTGRGEIHLTATISRVTEGVHLVEVHRGRGELLEYASLHRALRKQLSDIEVRRPGGTVTGTQ